MSEATGGPVFEDYDAADSRARERVEFLLGLRGRGISDIGVLRAMEIAPREHFVPRRHADLAWRNLALPIACGQTMPEPLLVARMMQALNVAPGHRVLEIGTGSGYVTAILAQLAGEVASFERYRSLAVEARTRLEGFGLGNVRIEWDDGVDAAQRGGPFDRILVHGLAAESEDALVGALTEQGVLLLARELEDGRRLVRLARNGGASVETVVAACRTGPLQRGRSAYL